MNGVLTRPCMTLTNTFFAFFFFFFTKRPKHRRVTDVVADSALNVLDEHIIQDIINSSENNKMLLMFVDYNHNCNQVAMSNENRLPQKFNSISTLLLISTPLYTFDQSTILLMSFCDY